MYMQCPVPANLWGQGVKEYLFAQDWSEGGDDREGFVMSLSFLSGLMKMF